MKTNSVLTTPLRLAALCLLTLAVWAPPIEAADSRPPERLNYQGFLVDASGVALGNTAPKNYDIIFRIYTEQGAGNRLWAEQQTVTIDKGYYSAQLGEGSSVGTEPRPALSSLFVGANASDRFVEMTVKGIGAGNSDVTILPRLRLLTAPYCFLAANVADGSVSAVKLADSNVTTDKLADGAITAAKLGNNSVTSTKLDDNSVSGPKLQAGSVTEVKLANGNVTTAKLADGSVTTAKLADGSVTPAKLAGSSVAGRGDVLVTITANAGQTVAGTATIGLWNLKNKYRFIHIHASTSLPNGVNTHNNTMLIHCDDLVRSQTFEISKYFYTPGDLRYLIVTTPSSDGGTDWRLSPVTVNATVKIRGLY